MAKAKVKDDIRRYYQIWDVNFVSVYEVNFTTMKAKEIEVCPGVWTRELCEFSVLDEEKFIAWVSIEGFAQIEDVPYECLLKGSLYKLVAYREEHKK